MSLRATRASCLALLLALASGARPPQLVAQLSDPCRLWCGVVLGATSFTVATGVLVARARYTGGISSTNEAVLFWGGSLAIVAGSGMALGVDGERQRRAVYAAGLGGLGAALAGAGIESLIGGGNRQRKVAAALMGAAVGAVVGGAYGALSHDAGEGGLGTASFALSLPLRP